jgi:hypothetical protein
VAAQNGKRKKRTYNMYVA